MKKISAIFLSIGCLSLIGGCFSSAYSLYLKNPTQKTVNITGIGTPETVDYYLNNSRSDSNWNNTANYKFTDVTSTMDTSFEPTKVKEYRLEGKTFSMNDELRVRDSNNDWITGSSDNYTHNSEYAVSMSGYNYKVLMSSTSYTFYLKFYSDKDPILYATAENNSFAFIPNSNWTGASAKFFCYLFGGSNAAEWTAFTDDSGTYRTTIVNGHTGMLVGRFNSSTNLSDCSFVKDGSGGHLWNQTGDITAKTGIHKTKVIMPSDASWDNWSPVESNWSFE